MRVLALDPATRCGWALWDGSALAGSGVVELDDSSAAARIASYEAWLLRRLGPLAHGAGRAALEAPAPVALKNKAGKRVTAWKAYRTACHLEGALLRLCLRWGVEVVAYQPAEVKQAVTGKGNAKKDAVRAAMRERWGLPGLQDDNEADALAVLATDLARSA